MGVLHGYMYRYVGRDILFFFKNVVIFGIRYLIAKELGNTIFVSGIFFKIYLKKKRI
jgi:hypothetical protein